MLRKEVFLSLQYQQGIRQGLLISILQGKYENLILCRIKNAGNKGYKMNTPDRHDDIAKQQQEFWGDSNNKNIPKHNSMKNTPNIRQSLSPNDYHNQNYRVSVKKKNKDEKLKMASNIDINMRKKVKTAGDLNHNPKFNSTFGSMNKATSNRFVYNTDGFTSGLDDGVDNFDFTQDYLEQAGVDADTPTLPFLENQTFQREDQPMPQHVPIVERNEIDFAYSYHGKHQQAKSSCSLRKHSHGHIQNNIFLITDKNFMKVKEIVG